MYFSDNSENTNIDQEFNQSASKRNFKFNKKILLISLSIIIIIIIFFIVFNKGHKLNQTYLVLDGATDIILYQDSTYVEPGYHAYDNQNNDLTEQVIIDNQVNSTITGEYTITYTINNIVKTRTITIVPKTNQRIYLVLKGTSTIFLKVGDTYQEPGYEVLDTTNYNSNDLVTVTGNVNTDKAGTYKLIYSITKNDGTTLTAERTIIVSDTDITLNHTPTNITNKPVTININISDNYFDYLLLPNGRKDHNRTTTYSVNQNGTYNFIVYSKDGRQKKATININNIDTNAPKIISCKGTINENKTTYTITTDESDIEKYVYNNQYTTTNKTYTINANVPNATVTVYDKAGNTSKTTCTSSVIYNYDQPINPQGNEVITISSSSDTLKYWVEKKTRSGRTSYYVAHIWVKNPYNQLKSGIPNNFGKELLTPKNILLQAITRNSLQNKSIIAINGSGFCLKDVFDVNLYAKNPAFNKTSVSPIVISEGNVIRDLTSGPIKTYTTYGLAKNGYLKYYNYSSDTQQNKATAQQIINDGIKDTWAFTPVLVTNGKAVNNLSNDKNIRNAICQINKNNFILITDIYHSPRNGFSFKELANYMVSLGCQTGFNLDGGGSVAMLYKEKNSTTPTVITGNSRNIADILYFHE